LESPEEQEFDVYWAISVPGKTPTDAAKAALAIMRDPQSTAVCFVVRDKEGKRYQIDLQELTLDELGIGWLDGFGLKGN